jgi:poly(3-hydroxybutyrate) depolymerase
MKLTLKSKLWRIAALAALALPGFSAQAVTAGPGAWSSQQTWAADSVNGGNLTGYFYWPKSTTTKNGQRALILVLHGCNQTATNDVINGSDGGFNWATTAENTGAVILAPNATGNVYSNHCWDYANTSPSRSSGHVGILLDLISRFQNNSSYSIDPNQVYVTGLSSGGGMTMVMGCIAPDIFAGIGINAGPSPGTTTSQIGTVPSGYTYSNAASICKQWAGSHASSFSTQIANSVWGTSDYIVAQGYGPLDMAAMRSVYGGSYTKGSTFTVSGGSGNGTGTPYTDSNGHLRTTEISVSGMSHAWPAGPGGQNTNYVDSTRITYPAYITSFWWANNLRVGSGGGTTTTTAGGTTTTTTATTTTTTAAATCYTSSNYAHVTAGRAHDSGGYALANGSNQNMGLDNTFYTTTLKKTGTNYYVIGTCP